MSLVLPKISVIVPVYNVEKYVAKCIDSIINQSYNNVELIIINDGSTDRSRDICDDYSNKDERIILINQEHQGIAATRNTGLDIADGDYIGFVDSDDWVGSDMFYTLYNNAITYDADISMCNFYYVHQDGEYSPYSNPSEGIKVLEGFYKISHNIRLSNNCLWNRIYKSYLFNDIRFPKGKLFEDIFIVHKLVDNANKVVLSADCKYYYLQRENGITLSSFNLSQLDNVEAYIERHNYISAKYPNLEKTCRKFIFSSLLWGVNKAYKSNSINSHKEALIKIIDRVRCYNYLDCGLSAEQKDTLNLLFDNIEKYIIRNEMYYSKSYF